MKVEANNKDVKFQLDTGSDITLINEQTWKNMCRQTQLKTGKLHVISGNKT